VGTLAIPIDIAAEYIVMASVASHVFICLDIDIYDDIGIEVCVVEELRKHGL
jgi:hypothetical protein